MVYFTSILHLFIIDVQFTRFPDKRKWLYENWKSNDNQIRCTLTREDLVERQIKLSELAYGTEKAKMLFRDMMQQAAYEFGFEADDIPLMIEAIPLSADTIILVITKVEYPEELDTRFPSFLIRILRIYMTMLLLVEMLRFPRGQMIYLDYSKTTGIEKCSKNAAE